MISQYQFIETDNYTLDQSVSVRRQTTTHLISQYQFTETDNYTLDQSVSIHIETTADGSLKFAQNRLEARITCTPL